MRRKNSQKVSDVIQEFLRIQGLETPLNEFRLINSWKDVMGDAVALKTRRIYIKDEVLCLEIVSPALRADLMMQRESIVAKLNNQVGFHVIRDIQVF